MKTYDVYKNGVQIFENEKATPIIRYLKIQKDAFYKAVKAGKQINGCDVIDLSEDKEEKVVSEEDKETRSFINYYGARIYREWLTMNIKYGGRVHG